MNEHIILFFKLNFAVGQGMLSSCHCFGYAPAQVGKILHRRHGDADEEIFSYLGKTSR